MRSSCFAWVVLAAMAGCVSDDVTASGDSSSGAPTSTTTGEGSSESSAPADSSSGGTTGPVAPPGGFTILTYNVAGLPQGISGSDPERNIPQISPLLNDFALVLVQEDFWYHPQLTADVTLPFQTDPWSTEPTLEDIGDGLNRFSEFELSAHERIAWHACHGQLDCASDCLATKGWSFGRVLLAPGVELDVYNLHKEAGGCPEDIAIRTQAAIDLAEAINTRSAGRAALVAGDFNLRYNDPTDVEPLETIKNGAGLTDVCEALDCGDERIDKIMIRSGDRLELVADRWWVPEQFVDAETGDPLSDHLPVAAELRYIPR